MNYHIAPVQGHTDAAWRHFHHEIYGDTPICYTPFIRWEKEGVRHKDVKDFTSDLNAGLRLIPQVIFRDYNELSNLVETLRTDGAKEIDINMGCPFPLQTARGRGAATIASTDAHRAVEKVVSDNPNITFSVKMRLGFKNPDEWKLLLPTLNKLKLSHITLHPRVATQQYGGSVDMQLFEQFLSESVNPVVYNGDITTPAQIADIEQRYPGLAGIMTGRGILGRPSLLAEHMQGEEWSRERRLSIMLTFHRRLLQHYSEVLCGDSQIISKISPFWDYAEAEIGRKAWKAIKKASTLPRYNTAVALIQQTL